MTRRQYILLFIVPYAALVVIVIFAFAVTRMQYDRTTERMENMASIAVHFLDEQCQLDGDLGKTRPDVCDRVDVLPQNGSHF